MSKDLKPWSVVSSRTVLDAAPRLRVRVETVELPDGRRVDDYYQLDMPPFVCVFAETDDGRVITYRQYRHGPRRVGLVFPGGHVEPGEEPLGAARRELLEETGCEAAAWTGLGAYTVNGNQGGPMAHLFRATGCRRIAAPVGGDLEEAEVLLLSRAELWTAAGRGEITLLCQVALLALATARADVDRTVGE
ncbi:NUDIX hydrolase [Gemmata massiliana]|uniref:NUDIX hydrolase n=1 Tax=Gemmata massiliana TaxID=1210884 RepID=UPI001E3206FD|nr:NUDIX hydrolase [Gemmata massiliana]